MSKKHNTPPAQPAPDAAAAAKKEAEGGFMAWLNNLFSSKPDVPAAAVKKATGDAPNHGAAIVGTIIFFVVVGISYAIYSIKKEPDNG